MPARLKVDRLDLNRPEVARQLLEGLKLCARERRNYRKLDVKGGCHFVCETSPPDGPGWYVLLVDNMPVYAGRADNLNTRLNTDNGSRDNFLNSKRTSDDQRNFIKVFAEQKLFGNLLVCLIPESQLAAIINFQLPLSDLDRNNVEKYLNIHRGFLWRLSTAAAGSRGE